MRAERGGARRAGKLPRVGAGARQVHGERAALSLRAHDRDAAAALANDAFDAGQTESRAASDLLCREKRLEDLRPSSRRNAAASVSHRDGDVRAGSQSLDALIVRVADLYVEGLQRDASAVRHG